MTFKELQIKSWEYKNKGDFIEGTYIDKKTGVGKNLANVYVLQIKDKSRIHVWGSSVLDKKMDDVSINTLIQIKYEGLVKSEAGRNYHDFKVLVDDGLE